MKSTFLVGVVAVILFSVSRCLSADPASQPSEEKIVIALAGDSTVTDVAGWAPGFQKCMAANITVKNLSRSGRSSKSFRDEKHWDEVLALKPDYVIIEFGHNDMPGKGPTRETDPNTTYRQNMEGYVDEARKAGIQPILATSIARREFNGSKIQSTLTPYTDVVKQIAAEKNVPLLDLHARTIELYEKLGPAGCDELSPINNGKVDHTHLNAKGGEVVGSLAAKELKIAVPELEAFVIARATTRQ